MPLKPLTCQRWQLFFAALADIQTTQVPRWVQYTPQDAIQIHGFCDASEKAYAVALHLRVQHSSGSWSSHLLCAKSKVAPVKQVALPRLELCGAVLLSKLAKNVLPHLSIPDCELVLWTDSSIVLAWLDKHPYTWKTFIGNRVSKIQNNLPRSKWLHIRSADNPADLATRGVSPKNLQTSSLWWNGPQWLRQPQSLWPISLYQNPDDKDMERRPIKANLATLLHNGDKIFQRFSSWSKTLHVLYYVLRFFNRTNPRNKGEFIYESTAISQDEIWRAKRFIIRTTQSYYFQTEYLTLITEEKFSSKFHSNDRLRWNHSG